MYIVDRNREGNKEKMLAAVKAFAAMFQTTVRYSLLKPLNQHYDIFISYSHKNSDQAQVFLKILYKLNPELSIFYDRIDLKAGTYTYMLLKMKFKGICLP